MFFKMLNRSEWKLSVHNPVKMLSNVDRSSFEEAVKNPKFLRQYDIVMAKFKEDMKAGSGWFFENVAYPLDLPIAFFSSEYGLHHSLPFYAGGLGFLAGDLLKECSDLGIPLVAVGFMYPEGYLKQRILAQRLATRTASAVDSER